MKTYKLLTILVVFLSFFSVQGFYDDLFKDKNLKPTMPRMTEAQTYKTLGVASNIAAASSLFFLPWVTWRFYGYRAGLPMTDLAARGALFPIVTLFNTIPGMIVAPWGLSMIGSKYFEDAQKLEKFNRLTTKIKSK